MEGVLKNVSQSKARVLIFDIIAISFIYLIPTFSHMINFPVYYLDPMRLMVFLVVIHTDKRNSYLIAATLPLVSFFISSHPDLLKSITLSAELMINVWLFFELSRVIKNKFAPTVFSIIISKAVYYLLKYILLSSTLLSANFISTPLFYQLIVIFIISSYAFIMLPQGKSIDK